MYLRYYSWILDLDVQTAVSGSDPIVKPELRTFNPLTHGRFSDPYFKLL